MLPRRIALAAALAAGCGGGGEDPELPPWSPERPPAAEAMGARRGLIPARGIVHLHSPYSHDACDGEPRDPDTNAVDEACLADLRAALCAARIDFAALTDHDDSMADEPFADLFLARDGDELLGPAGAPAASRITCPNGHRVLVSVGGENDLMPVMLNRHPEGDAARRHQVYNAEDAATVAKLRDLGGLVVVPHTESRDLDRLRAIAPDGVEIYNLHANLDPDIREEHLGLDGPAAIRAVVEFADTSETGPEPDLALISFVEPSAPAIDRWQALLGDGARVFATAGTDAHQNALPLILRDGERADSYRRMLVWFSNVALVTDPGDPVAAEAALAAGRSFIAFELFGTPSGFDVVATDGASTAELGDEIAAGAGHRLEVTLPGVHGLDPSLPEPAIRGRVVHIDGAGAREVAAGSGPLVAPLDAPGAYRVEVLITPRHLGPYLGSLGPELADRERVWIYSNPIYVSEGSSSR